MKKTAETQVDNKPISIEVLHKEIDLIQDVVKRMASNSFLVKGWMLTLVSGIVLVSKGKIWSSDSTLVGTVIVAIVLVFWYLDSFFLHREKCFRKLYDFVVSNRNDPKRPLYSLNYEPFEESVGSIFISVFNRTIWPFYLIPLIATVLISILATSNTFPQ